mgnify:CR=1 FL=1
MIITKPGIYQDCDATAYHGDPVAVPSLSSTMAKLLVTKSPRHAWLAHPKLGGAKEEGDEEGFDPSASKAKALGELIHALVLGKGAEIVVINADSWRTNAAKAERDAAVAAGHIAVLAHKLPEAQAAAAAWRSQLDDMGFDRVFRDGMKEVVLVWEENGTWFRAMIDQLIIDEDTKTAEIWDLKTVGRSSHPAACAKQITDFGYDLSLDFYSRGLVALRPDLAGRIKKRWVFGEVAAPFAATPIEINGEWEMVAQMQCDRAIALWRKCVAENRWPFYASDIVRLEPKPWMIADAMAT